MEEALLCDDRDEPLPLPAADFTGLEFELNEDDVMCVSGTVTVREDYEAPLGVGVFRSFLCNFNKFQLLFQDILLHEAPGAWPVETGRVCPDCERFLSGHSEPQRGMVLYHENVEPDVLSLQKGGKITLKCFSKFS